MGWGEFILQYLFNELVNRMSKLEKGQNITKTAEETGVELDKGMSMDAEIIGKFITQQVAVTISEKTKSIKIRSRNLRKAEETECQESHPQEMVRGAVDAPPRKRNHSRLKQTPGQDHLRNLRLDWHKSKRVSFKAPQEDNPNKQAMPTVVRKETGKRK